MSIYPLHMAFNINIKIPLIYCGKVKSQDKL